MSTFFDNCRAGKETSRSSKVSNIIFDSFRQVSRGINFPPSFWVLRNVNIVRRMFSRYRCVLGPGPKGLCRKVSRLFCITSVGIWASVLGWTELCKGVCKLRPPNSQIIRKRNHPIEALLIQAPSLGWPKLFPSPSPMKASSISPNP